MPALLSASSQSLLAVLLGNYSLDCRVRSMARKPWSPAEHHAPAASPTGCPGLRTLLREPGTRLCPAPEGLTPAIPPGISAVARGAVCTTAAASAPGISQDRRPAGTLGWTPGRSPHPLLSHSSQEAPGRLQAELKVQRGREGLGQARRWAAVTALVRGKQGSRSRMPQSTQPPCLQSFPCPANAGRSQPRAWTQAGVPPPSILAPVPGSPAGQKQTAPRPVPSCPTRSSCEGLSAPHVLVCTRFHRARPPWLSLLQHGAEAQMD